MKLFIQFPQRSKFIKLKQEALFKMSLLEIGIDPSRVSVKVDHVYGENFIQGMRFGLIFPKYFFQISSQLKNQKKTVDFFFDGYPGDDEGRKTLLQPFVHRNSIIRYSNNGRKPTSKGVYNKPYFDDMASSRFALCPNQKDWPHKQNFVWTYRFVEACMAFSIPIIFRETPLSDEFTTGISYFYDDQILQEEHYFEIETAEKNFEAARHKFTFSDADVDLILTKLSK